MLNPSMEISSSPFQNQEDYSHFLTVLQEEMDNFNQTAKKRRIRKDEDYEEEDLENKSMLREILGSLVMAEEEEEKEQWPIEPQPDNSQSGHQAMNNYFFTQPQDHYSGLNQVDQSRTKRSRQSSIAVPSSSSVVENGGSEQVRVGSASSSGPHRRLWVKDRPKDWWIRCNDPDFPDEDFKRDFRMSKSTFDMICKELDSSVMKKNTMLRQAIPVRQRVAVCIWRLATGEPLRLVSKRFGLGISTCHKLVLEVCSAIRTVLMPKYLQWPEESEMKKIKEQFESISGIPNVGGSIYTTHVPIIAPKVNVAAYFNKRHTERNQKTSYSITVQGVVDPKGIFTDVCIGWPGSMPDDQVLEKSALFERAKRGLLKDVWIVGNAGYPLTDWVLVPYKAKNLTWAQHGFNERVGEVEKVCKEAFGRLKGRWSCLQRRTEVKLQELPVVLGACCVLHNICEMRGEGMEEEWRYEVFDDEMVAEETGVRSVGSVRARDKIAHDLLHHGLAGTSFL